MFVLDDGGEADLDLGNYERFLDITLPRTSNITTGKVYQEVKQSFNRPEQAVNQFAGLQESAQAGRTKLCQLFSMDLQVIDRERRGDYLGKTVQVIPHVTDCIQDWIEKSAIGADEPEICVIELGGTVGDIESMPFVEALRQLKYATIDMLCGRKPYQNVVPGLFSCRILTLHARTSVGTGSVMTIFAQYLCPWYRSSVLSGSRRQSRPSMESKT